MGESEQAKAFESSRERRYAEHISQKARCRACKTQGKTKINPTTAVMLVAWGKPILAGRQQKAR